MAKFFESEKRRKRLTAALCGVLSITLSMGIFSACTNPADDDEKSDSSTTNPTDTQLLKNGNFEFYGEMTKDFDDKLAFINNPSSYNWSFSSGSPASESASGIVNVGEEWTSMAYSTFPLVQDEDRKTTNDEGEEVDAEHAELSTKAYKYAEEHWDDASIYDRLEFYDFYEITSKNDFELYGKYNYSIDFDDVKYFGEEIGDLKLYDESKLDAEEPETGVLMIHNKAESYNVQGTAQSYTSGTTLTLAAGTAAEVSVWVKTANLRHYSTDNEDPVTKRAGAYIGVTQTVGGVTLEQMQIKNIITENDPETEATNGWKQYTVYIRANTFASTTFRLVLGLGQGSSSNRYEAVNGYAFFDDVTCKIISTDDFDDAVQEHGLVERSGENGNFCDLNSRSDDKKFYATTRTTGTITHDTYAIDLSANFNEYNFTEDAKVDVDLTKTQNGSNHYWTSADIDASLSDTRSDRMNPRRNLGDKYTLSDLENLTKSDNAYYNGYLANIFKNDFADFPFQNTNDIVFLLSANGAAYTAKLPEIELEAKSRMLFSFYVKTSDIRDGMSGAGATLFDGNNPVAYIEPFNSTKVSTVDIDKDSDDPALKDIYKGWVQCFFFVENDTDAPKRFHVELTYGPLSIVKGSTSKNDFCDGYAAFANFQVASLTKTQYGYAAASSYAQKASLTSVVRDSSAFDSASATGRELEKGIATPANWQGRQAGSNYIVQGGTSNPERADLERDGLWTGLLSAEYAENYYNTDAAWKNVLDTAANGATSYGDWWTNIFGNKGSAANVAYQPLVFLNATGAPQPSYGYWSTSQIISASTAIRVRVKLSAGATASIYLIDLDDDESEIQRGLTTTVPSVTYWYDDDGNIVSMDPGTDEYDESGKILYELQSNGLYKDAQNTSDNYYYANLSAYTEKDGNLVTSDGTIAFYGQKSDNGEIKYFYYYDEDAAEGEQYSVEVHALPDGIPTRYGEVDNSKYAACIQVTGDESNADQWVTVTFFVRAGKNTKNYRIELWAGARDQVEDGIPAGGYVFFDRITNPSATFATELDTAVEALKEKAGLKKDQNLTEAEEYADIALYYTFTFFDSVDYLRYDADTDEDDIGNPWKNFKQSDYSEQLAYLYLADEDGSLLGSTGPSYTKFIDFTATETAVTRATTGSSSSSGSSSSTDDDSDPDETNFWLSLASILLVVALILAVIAVIVRRAWKKRKKSKAPKAKRPAAKAAPAPAKPQKVEETEEEPEAPAAPADENDPYNE